MAHLAHFARLAALCLIAQVAFSTGAAEASSDPHATAADSPGLSILAERLSVPTGEVRSRSLRMDQASAAMWSWPAANRGYFLWGRIQLRESMSAPPYETGGSRYGFRYLVGVDLASGKEFGRTDLGLFPSHHSTKSGPEGDPRIMAVDPGGRLFLAHTRASRTVTGPSGDPVQGAVHRADSTPHDTGNISVRPEEGEACVASPQQGLISCLAGITEIDATTLEVTRRTSLQGLRVEANGRPLAMNLLAMEFVPDGASKDGDKLVLLVQDWSTFITPNNLMNAGTSTMYGSMPHYTLQLDIDSGVVDWVIRVDGCRNVRERGDGGAPGISSATEQYVAPMSHAAAIVDGRLRGRNAVTVACHTGNAAQVVVTQIPLDIHGMPSSLPIAAQPAKAREDVAADGPPQASGLVGSPSTPFTVPGPDRALQLIADPASGQLLVGVLDGTPQALVWWVFDTTTMRFRGTVGMGRALAGTWSTTIDRATGRLYVLPTTESPGPRVLYVANTRSAPLAQALIYPEVAEDLPELPRTSNDEASLSFVSAAGDRPARLYVPNTHGQSMTWLAIVEDRHVVEPPHEAGPSRTYDLVEAEGVTSASLEGAARGYGLRAILVGGAEGASRVGPVDPLGNVYQWETWNVSLVQSVLNPMLPNSCVQNSREIVVAAIGMDGPAVVDASGARGTAEPLVLDSGTRADTEIPVSRCTDRDWQQLFTGALFGTPPVREPQFPGTLSTGQAQCVSGEQESSSVQDSVTGRLAAEVHCDDEEAGGFSYARGMQAGDLGIAESLTSFRIYRDPARGVVSRVESVARGVNVAGLLQIGTVRGMAESWANGRAFTAPLSAGEDYEPNCDFERTAGTCFQRHLFGLRTPAYSCGPCGDEAQLIERVNRQMSGNMQIRFREPDPDLARGSTDGFQSAVIKPVGERFSDLVLNEDALQTVLPSLEIVRYAPSGRLIAPGGPRGRQIIQLAGVEVASSYAIQCLLVYDEVANTCAEAVEAPGSITVSLVDVDGQPLAGGAFEVHRDADADGVLGLTDALVADGACVTAQDGVGTCTFTGLPPGTYLVSQTAAPAGYAMTTQPWVSQVSPGELRTVVFTNVSDSSSIELTVTDQAGAPVAGAAFAAYPDPDGDGKIAPDAQPAGQCTTDADGVCSMQVPAGSYVLVQTSAPAGLEAIEPVAFAFASGGQVAAVGVVNHPPDTSQPPAAPAVPVYTPPVDIASPVETIGHADAPAQNEPSAELAPDDGIVADVGGTVVRVIRAPGDALRLLARDPKQAVAWTAALALFAMAALAVQRRGRLTTAFTGGITAPPHRPPPAPPSGHTRGPSPSDRGSGGPRPSAPTGPRPPGSSASRVGVRNPAGSGGQRLVAGGAPAAVEGVHVEVVVAVSNPVVAAVVTQRLAESPHCTVLAHVDSADALREVLEQRSPEVLVVDLGLPTGHDLDVCDLLPGLHDAARTVGLIPPNRSPQALFARGYSVGLGGMLLADEDLTDGQLAYAVRCVAAGKPFFGPSVQALLMKGRDRTAEKARRRLTAKELKVARLAAQGLSRMEIAERLVVSPATVKTQLRAVRIKLGITDPRDHRQIRRRLVDLGLLREETPE